MGVPLFGGEGEKVVFVVVVVVDVVVVVGVFLVCWRSYFLGFQTILEHCLG